jgi:hypothetical protein
MADRSDWTTCVEDGCAGVQLPFGGRCWAHANGHDLDTALERLTNGDDLDSRGVVFTASLLQRLLDAVPHDAKGQRAIVSEARFGGATFEEDARFEGVKFAGDADFGGATFAGAAGFRAVTFAGDADFFGVSVTGDADFGGASFEGDVRSDLATFTANAAFEERSSLETFPSLRRSSGAMPSSAGQPSQATPGSPW